jgi:hypothetical protein
VTNPAISHSVSIRVLVAAVLVASAGMAQPLPQEPKAKRDKNGTEADEEYRHEAEKLMKGIELEAFADDKWSKVKRNDKPLLYYGDPTRENDRGSLWAWGDKGRPVATLELYQNVADRKKWAFAICNTSGGKLRASRAGAAWWRENESESQLKEIPGAPVPSADPTQRQRQLKLLAQKFTGHQFWDPNNTRYELRRLERPLQTYRDQAAGIIDGALFSFANGTNPEIILFVEARMNPKDTTKTVWQYTVGRSAHAELHLNYDGKQAYEAPRGNRVSASDKPYWLGFINSNAPNR